MTGSAYKTALLGCRLGLFIVPPKEDGTKAPDADRWRVDGPARPDEDQIDRWYVQGSHSGVGIVCGAASMNLECIDFDAIEAYEAYVQTARDLGWDDLVDRIEAGYLERSPGGVHWLYYCSEIGGNNKLARRPKQPDEMRHPKDAIKTLIETRSEGGYIIIAPTSGAVHETGRPYVLERGSLKTIITITPDERDDLLGLARSFDQIPEERTEAPTSRQSRADGGRPGDDFISRGQWRDVLAPHGWRELRTINGETFWRRPGKDRGQSATTNYHGSDLLYVFSSSTEFEVERGYNKFSAYAILEHAGDWSAASRDLRRQGYGPQLEAVSLGRIRANGTAAHATEDGDDGGGTTLPEIYADEQDLRIITGQAWDALAAVNESEPFMFRHGGALVRIEQDDQRRPIFRELTLSVIRHEMARSAVWWGMRGAKAEKARKVVVPPEVVCQDVLATPAPPLPTVTRVTECPTFGPDWSVRVTTGYHAPGRTYCAIPSDMSIPPIPACPSPSDIRRARALILEEVLGDFPFVGPADLANAVGLFLLPFVRDAISGPTPLHMVESPTVGTGKGLIVDALLRASCGRSIAAIAQCREGDEWRKRITSMLRGGFPAIQIDNVTRALDSGELAMAITVPYWTDRLLGSSQTVSYPVRCVWVATANNPVLSTEMARRSIRIRMDPRVDKPWEREGFRHKELLSWIEDHRTELVWASLTLIQAWSYAGRTNFSGRALGSFEPWTRVIGGILEHAKIPGFLGNLAEFYEQADTEGSTWRAFTEAWWEKFEGKEVGASDLFPLALECDGFEVTGNNERAQKTSFGKALSKQRDRVIGRFRVVVSSKERRNVRWRLLPVEPT